VVSVKVFIAARTHIAATSEVSDIVVASSRTTEVSAHIPLRQGAEVEEARENLHEAVALLFKTDAPERAAAWVP
jgi:hypothetical protein